MINFLIQPRHLALVGLVVSAVLGCVGGLSDVGVVGTAGGETAALTSLCHSPQGSVLSHVVVQHFLFLRQLLQLATSTVKAAEPGSVTCSWPCSAVLPLRR